MKHVQSSSLRIIALFSCAFMLLSSCSINNLAVRAAADALSDTGSGTVFTGDNDPELIEAALPFAIKMYEAILAEAPDHEALALTTGSLCVMYGNAFVQSKADMLDIEYQDLKHFAYKRAKNLYLRGYSILSTRFLKKYPKAFEAEGALPKFTKQDVPYLYWISASLMSALAIDPLDVNLSVKLPVVKRLIETAYTIDPDFNSGAIDDFFVSFYASIPSGAGGSIEKAKKHFALALEKSKGKTASPYISYALSIDVGAQDYKNFKSNLEKALAIDVNADVGNRLANIIAQRKAQSLLDSAELRFIDIGQDEEFEGEE